MIRPVLVLAAVMVGACGLEKTTAAVSVTGGASRSVAASVGDEIDITLQTVGFGEYASPPEVSSSAVQFLSVGQASVTVPAGPTQIFRFRAVAPGQAIVVFTHTGQVPPVSYPNVVDTLVVR